MPHEIWVQEELEDAEVIASFLTARRGQKVRFVVPKMGEKERLVELAEKNAKMVLSQDKEKIKREELRTIGAMNQIGSWIGLSGIKRVEAYDISNISGFESVGSMIVYENGRPKRNDYRKFRIRTVQGSERLRFYARGAAAAVFPWSGGDEENASRGRRFGDGKFYAFSRSADDGWRTRTG